MTKIVHTADVHINRKFLQFKNKTLREDFKNELLKNFKAVLEFVKKNKVNFLIISGDLFEDELPHESDIIYVNDLLKAVDPCEVIICFGNHDPYFRGSKIFNFNFAKNIHIFKTNEITSIEVNKVRFFGASFTSSKDKGLISLKSVVLKKDIPEVLVFHGNIDDPKTSLSLELSEIKEKGFTYCALGHIHKRKFLTENIAYSGSIIAFDKNEDGPKGFIYGDLDTKKYDFVDFDTRQSFVYEIKLNENDTIFSLEESVKKLIKDDKNFYTFLVTGKINPQLFNSEKFIEKTHFNEDLVSFRFNTRLFFDLEKLKNERKDDIVGKVIAAFSKIDEETEIKDSALDLILERLLENEL